MLTPEEQKTWPGEGDRVWLAKRFQSGVEAVDADTFSIANKEFAAALPVLSAGWALRRIR